MIRLSKLTDYGFVLLTRFSVAGTTKVHNARDIADEVHVPRPTVSKLLKALARGGLLKAHRGAKGGYALAKPADKITVAEVISALEGPIGITECSANVGCGLENQCPTSMNWRRVNNAVFAALEGITLADMLAPAEDMPPARTETELPPISMPNCRTCPAQSEPAACTCSLDAGMLRGDTRSTEPAMAAGSIKEDNR